MSNDIISEEEYPLYDNNMGNIYDTPQGYIKVGNLKVDDNPQDSMFMTHPRNYKVTLQEATNVGNKRNHDMIAYKATEGTAYTGKIDDSWINNNICDCDKPRTPSLCTISNKKVEEYNKNKSAYTIYINPDKKKYKDLIRQKLGECVNKISKDKKNLEHKMGYAKYKKEMENDKNMMGYNEYLKQQEKEKKMKIIDHNANINAEKMSAFNNAISNNQNALNILNQMGENRDELLYKNSNNINKIDEKILTTSEKINNLKDKYEFNNKIIKLLRTITLWIFIISMFVLCYYGVRDKYVDTIKPSAKVSK